MSRHAPAEQVRRRLCEMIPPKSILIFPSIFFFLFISLLGQMIISSHTISIHNYRQIWRPAAQFSIVHRPSFSCECWAEKSHLQDRDSNLSYPHNTTERERDPRQCAFRCLFSAIVGATMDVHAGLDSSTLIHPQQINGRVQPPHCSLYNAAAEDWYSEILIPHWACWAFYLVGEASKKKRDHQAPPHQSLQGHHYIRGSI